MQQLIDMDLRVRRGPIVRSHVRREWSRMLVGLEDLTWQSFLFGGSNLPLSSGPMGKRVFSCLVPDGTGRDPDGMTQTSCMPVLDSQGVRVGKGTSGGEPPTWWIQNSVVKPLRGMKDNQPLGILYPSLYFIIEFILFY